MKSWHHSIRTGSVCNMSLRVKSAIRQIEAGITYSETLDFFLLGVAWIENVG